MKKGIASLTLTLLVFILTPSTFAQGTGAAVTGANLKIQQNALQGIVKICNHENEDLRLRLAAKNLNTNHLYHRNLLLRAAACDQFRIKFSDRFGQMSEPGDTIKFSLKKVRGERTATDYTNRDTFSAKVQPDETKTGTCKNNVGKDGLYTNLCAGDFIDHQPSGLRIKLVSKEGDQATLLVNHIKWGGTQEVRLYKGKSAEFMAGDTAQTRIRVTHLESSVPSLQLTSY